MNDITAVMRHRADFARAIANKQFEVSDTGILFPKQKTMIAGVFGVEHRRAGRMLDNASDPNIIPTQGLNHILDVVAHGVTAITPWYVALFSGNVTPGASLTGANFTATCTEFTGYDEATRVVFNEGASAGGVLDNASDRAIFTVNAAATIYGGALLSASAKSANGAGDVCLAGARFSSSRAVISGDELAVKYTLTATSA